MHECKCKACDPAYQARTEEIARISAKSELRRTVKKEEKDKMVEKARIKFRAEIEADLKGFEVKCRQEIEKQIRSDAFLISQEQWRKEERARLRAELTEEFNDMKKKFANSILQTLRRSGTSAYLKRGWVVGVRFP